MSHTIHAFLLAWNEIDIAKMVIDHHKKFCDKITIMDNYSTDGTPELALKMGCEVRQFGTKFFDDEQNMICKNTCWKSDIGEWNVVADFDELLMSYSGYFPGQTPNPEDIRSRLHGSPHDVVKTIGWQVMSDKMPQNDLLEETNGFRFDNYSKNILFSCAITDMNYTLGAHECKPVNCRGDAIDWGSEGAFHVMHYKHIGGVQRTIDRYKQYKPRMSKFNRRYGHGSHYNRTVSSLKQEWAERMAISKPLI